MIHVNNYDHGQMIMKAINSDFTEVTMQVISRSENGVLYGGVVYENYTGPKGSCLVHIAGFNKRWINRDMLYIMFDFPFRQLDCRQAFCQVAGKNTETLAFNKSFGWEEVITLEDVFPDDDMILMRMRRDNCRYLDVKPRTVQSRRTENNG
jgi:RimJ/RimL family protein N-acetyltransferase